MKTCPKCNKGLLILDQNPGVKPTLSCNYCTHHMIIGDQITLATRMKKKCSTCNAHHFKLTFRSAVQGLTAQSYDDICIFCHVEYSKYLASKNVVIEPKEPRGYAHYHKKQSFNKRGRGKPHPKRK